MITKLEQSSPYGASIKQMIPLNKESFLD